MATAPSSDRSGAVILAAEFVGPFEHQKIFRECLAHFGEGYECFELLHLIDDLRAPRAVLVYQLEGRSLTDAFSDFGDMVASAVKCAGYTSPAFNGIPLSARPATPMDQTMQQQASKALRYVRDELSLEAQRRILR